MSALSPSNIDYIRRSRQEGVSFRANADEVIDGLLDSLPPYGPTRIADDGSGYVPVSTDEQIAWTDGFATAHSATVTMQEWAVEAVSTLENYGVHHDWCAVGWPVRALGQEDCTCGLTNAIASLRGRVDPREARRPMEDLARIAEDHTPTDADAIAAIAPAHQTLPPLRYHADGRLDIEAMEALAAEP